MLSVSVAKNGAVANIEVESGDPTLVKAALEAVRQWRYSPPASVPAVATVTVSFVLDR